MDGIGLGWDFLGISRISEWRCLCFWCARCNDQFSVIYKPFSSGKKKKCQPWCDHWSSRCRHFSLSKRPTFVKFSTGSSKLYELRPWKMLLRIRIFIGFMQNFRRSAVLFIFFSINLLLYWWQHKTLQNQKYEMCHKNLKIVDWCIFGWDKISFRPLFIGPESYHWECLSLTHSLTDSLTDSLTPV